MSRNLVGPIATCLVVTALVAGCGGAPPVAERIAKGDELLKQGKLGEALIEYRQAVQSDERNAEARQKLGRAFVAAGQPQGAVGQFVRAADLLPNDVPAQLEAARLLLAAGQFEDARTRAEAALKTEPTNAQALVLRAGAAAQMKDTTEALKSLDEAVKSNPNRSSTFIDRARIQASEGKFAEAEAGFKQALVVAPKSLDAHMALANFYWVSGRRDDATAALRKATEVDARSLPPYLTLANLYWVTGKIDLAEGALKKVAELSTEPDARLTLADFYVALRRYQEAKPILTELAKNKDAAVASRGRLAGIEYQEGRREQAHKMVDALIAENPKNVAVVVINGNWLLGEGKRDEALAAANTALQVEPRSVDALLLKGAAHVQRNDAAEAETAFSEVLKIQPKAVDALVALAHLNVGINRLDTAAVFAQQAVDARSEVPTRFAMARVLVAQRKSSEARAELLLLTKVVPDNPDVLNLQGLFLRQEGDMEGARQAYSRALTLAPTSDAALRGLFELDLRTKRTTDSKQRVEAYLKKNPDDARALVTAGRVYAATGDLQRAETSLRKAVDLDPTLLEGYHVLGQILVRQKKLDEARKAYQDRAAERPNDVAAYTMIGMIQLVQGDMAGARAQFEKVLSIDPRSPVASNNLAYMDAEAGTNLDVALNRAQAAKAANPDNANVDDTIGWVYVKRGLPALAVSPLEQATQKEPQNPTFHYHLGMAHVAGGDKDRARLSLQKALQLSKNFVGAADAQRALTALGR